MNSTKMFNCDKCNKSYKCASGLWRHNQVKHVGVTFECEQCDASFGENGNLQQHIRSIHEGERFECEECNKLFTQKSNLTQHVKVVHTGIKKFHCPVCERRFGQKIELQRHKCDTGIKGSRGEQRVHETLESLGFEFVEDEIDDMSNKFIREASFEDLIGLGGRRLKYDFKVFLNDEDYIFVEFDGIQHRRPVRFGSMTSKQAKKAFKKTRAHDLLKDDYALWEGVNLLRIPCNLYDQVDVIVESYIKQCRNEIHSDWLAEQKELLDLDIQNQLVDSLEFIDLCDVYENKKSIVSHSDKVTDAEIQEALDRVDLDIF